VTTDGPVSQGRLNLPNIITIARIFAAPAVFVLATSPGIAPRFWAFVLFVTAALSDLWDGYLARKHGWVTDMGKLLDPIADKLLMLATFIPFYMVSQAPGEANDVPFWGPMPLWVLIVIFGRELFITLFRSWATGKGVVIAAGRSGKHKALLQALFAGGLLLWYPLLDLAAARGWTASGAWVAWSTFHRVWVGVTLAVALILTIYSMIDYLWRYRSLYGMRD
jgi:CDP-diacylglycerol--glycerol-3-phosphate 3-phosphatidyltransferase